MKMDFGFYSLSSVFIFFQYFDRKEKEHENERDKNDRVRIVIVREQDVAT